MIDFLILGADGQQGTIATRKLLQEGFSVVCSDIYFSDPLREVIANTPVRFEFCDHRNKESLDQLVKKTMPRVIINAADDFYNDTVFDICLANRVNHIDFGSDIAGTMRRLKRHDEFRNAGIIAVMSCGSVPGIGSVMTKFLIESHGLHEIDRIESGFAWASNMVDFVPPFFLFIVLLELSLPADIIEHHTIRQIPPLSVSDVRNFPLVGEQKIYAVSHSEIGSYQYYFNPRHMIFWAGFPAHSMNVIQALISAGLNRNTPIRVIADSGAVDIHPCDFLTAIAKTIKTPEGYEEKEFLWSKVDGYTLTGEKRSLSMGCLVPPLRGWEKYGCNVDTAFPGVAIAKMIYSGQIYTPGVYCPEAIVPCEQFFNQMTTYGFSFTTENVP